MFFTQEDYLKIENWLKKRTIKDTEFNNAETPLKGNEMITLIQNGTNVKTYIKDFITQLFAFGINDFLNITSLYNKRRIALNDAIELVPYTSRKVGQVITFCDEDGNWQIYQYIGESLLTWNNLTLWKDIIQAIAVAVNIVPDEEDVTGVTEGEATVIKFKNKRYDSEEYSGLGRVYLRKNIQTVGSGDTARSTNLLTQSMFLYTNSIYIVQYDYDLNGSIINVPTGSILDFQGGSIDNGTINFPEGTYIRNLYKGTATITGNPTYIDYLVDEEDVTTENGILKFKDKEYSSSDFSGLGRKYLRKNIVDGKNILTQDMINSSNTIYIIQYDYDLNGQTITVPEGCVLQFEGGSISNGTITCVNTIIESKTRCFINIVLSDIECVSADWFYDGQAATIIELINQGFTIKFSDKTYIFETSISTNKRFNIKGAGKNSTILVFPNSSGIERILPYEGAWDRNNSIEDLTIDSKDTCISLGNSILGTSNMLSVSTFRNLNLITQTGYCIYNKLDGTANSQPYHNLFENIELHHGNSCKPYIYGVIGLNNIFKNIYDIDTTEKKAISMFQNCSGSFEDLNISYGMSIDNFLLIGPSESTDSTIITADNTTPLYKSNNKGDIGTIISLSNCNFEAFQGGFIKVTADNIYPNVEFNSNVQFNYINSIVSTNDYLIECFGLKRWKGSFNFYGTSSSYIMTYSPVKINSTEELTAYQENIIRPLRVEGIDYLKIARFVNSIQEGTDIVYENSIPSQHISNNTETLYTSNVFVFKRNNERYYASNRSKPIYSDYLLNNAIYTAYTDVDTSIFYSVFIPDNIRVTVDSDVTVSNIGIVEDVNNENSYRKKPGTLLRMYIDPSSTGSITLKFNDTSYSQSYIILTEEQQSSLILEAGETYYFELIITTYGVYAWKMIKYKIKYPDNAIYGTSIPFIEKGSSPQKFFDTDTGNNYYSAEDKEGEIYWRNEDGTLTSKVIII